MDTQPKTTCPQCGAPLPPDAPAGLCPQCLMALNFMDETVLPGAAPHATTAQPPLPPEEIAPHFPQLDILKCLGRGGMGMVYKARQKSLNRFVALKLLAPERAEDPQFAARFEKEARALAALDHPNIVTIHDHGQAGGFYYLLMEYVDGVDLGQLLHGGRVSPREALAIVPQICDALQYAHDQGIVHRDIKPGNILLDRRGRVKVADFGLAKIVTVAAVCDRRSNESENQRRSQTDATEDQTVAGKVMGTPDYMAPEQAEHPSEVDHRADIYALGVVFYQMLTGELPGKELAPPSSKVSIDVRLDEVVLRALEKKPELRYQQASILKTQVETIASEAGKAADSKQNPNQPHPVKWPKWMSVTGMRDGTPHVNWPGVAICLGMASVAGWILLVLANAVFSGGSLPQGVFLIPILTAVGYLAWAISTQLRQLRRTPVATVNPATPPDHAARQSEMPSRFSRTAIVGACWALIFVVAGLMFSVRAVPVDAGQGSVWQNYHEPGWRFWGLMLTVMPWGLSAPFGTTILGWVAVSQIRRSAGKLHGMWLAVFDGLLFPLLLLDVGIWLLIGNLFRTNPSGYSNPVSDFFVSHESVVLLIAVTCCALADLLIIRRVWRAVHSPVGTQSNFSAQTPTAEVPAFRVYLKTLAWLAPLLIAWFAAVILLLPKLHEMALQSASLAEVPLGLGRILSDMAAYSGWVLLGLVALVILAELAWPRWKAIRQQTLTVVSFTLSCLILLGLFLMILMGGLTASAPTPRSQTVSSPESEPAAGPVIELPDNATIQLVALSVGPRGTTSWWSPEGRTLSKVNWTETASTVTDWPTSPREKGLYGDHRVLQVVAAVQGGNPPAELLDPFFDGVQGRNTTFQLEQNGRPLMGWQGFQKVLPKDAKTARVGFTVAAGPFQTETAGRVTHFDEHSMVGELCGEKFNFGKLSRRGRNAAITLSLVTQFEADGSPKYRHRVQVDTADGKTVLGRIVEGQSTDTLRSEVWEFDGVPPKQVKAVHFEVRPICRVEFRNVSLWPGTETKVEAVSGSALSPQAGRTLDADKTNRDGLPGDSSKDTDRILVEDLALHMIVAIREKDDAKLRALASDRIKGWPDALPQFAVEMRERYRQSTGNEAFDLRPNGSLVDGGLAVVRCTGPAALKGQCLVLFFVKTDAGWRNHSLRNASGVTPLEQHLDSYKRFIEKEPPGSGNSKSNTR